jgi:hypothetical protein
MGRGDIENYQKICEVIYRRCGTFTLNRMFYIGFIESQSKYVFNIFSQLRFFVLSIIQS